MNVVLHRRSLDLASGAGQLVAAQARALEERGAAVTLACRRGALKFFLRSGRWPRHWTAARIAALQRSAGLRVVDHSLEIPSADVVFVHNLQSEANRYLEREDLKTPAAAEAAFFRALRADAPIVANSELVADALARHFDLARDRIAVVYPGFDAGRFSAARLAVDRARSRRSLAVDDAVPLVGFVTSGDFGKRGLDLFFAAAEDIVRAVPHVRFLVVGSKALPEWAERHPLVTGGRVAHRPKSADPARWFAALDVFLYPARFEEFGIVVLEALACGLPVLTSRRVGAHECLPADYETWLLDAPDAAGCAANTVRLLADDAARARLGAAGRAAAARWDAAAHGRAAAALILG